MIRMQTVRSGNNVIKEYFSSGFLVNAKSGWARTANETKSRDELEGSDVTC